MANRAKSVPQNVGGEFFVDSTCIDCGACQNLVPAVFKDYGDGSYVASQPATEAERLRAFQAQLACPVNAIGSAGPVPSAAHASFPLEIEPGSAVYLNGFNARDSFGADSYFIRSPAGNWLIDSPRFTPHLRERFRAMGGLRFIFLTHRDDVADADRYAAEFGAERVIHERDADACPTAEIRLRADDDLVIGEARMIATPGHTRGHAVLLWKDRFLFTGDHLPWSSAARALRPFRGACWYSWPTQIASVEKLAVHANVAHVLTGHGERWHAAEHPARADFPALVREAVGWMRGVGGRGSV